MPAKVKFEYLNDGQMTVHASMTCVEPSPEDFDTKAKGQPAQIVLRTEKSKTSYKPEHQVLQTPFIYVTLES
jgi:hypothetical protein